ncbi:MAG: hypothetical protein A2845_00205 [Candidatus Lloydbacteria bacterium RIFCSPHIGHO2_01_FULL_49_22]|uniref:Uncharacterized protein n=1 Tax=Candidatus Lloydbacteria bacterium RIFCSPHIGHO2_01_FULL_49_22 TaxID=1798658 RepID=A0A1G2D0C7_9BACT|nr:MAG: hypothetical protein A2845_00205 [Candidatus Lloydbacteria bacterium RIFCSPHIGHO2_01_FULL_49_22]OGZ09289.1 MAG: hypothetical protein A3C14_05110 [Candidatus Lloydbacteria bacterium RIFCSPHIGHO2_02_FULL_50_18]
MKEISYDGPTYDESEQRRKKARSRGSEKVPPLRTFRGDVADLVTKQNMTKTQMVIAETERREERGETRTIHEGGSHLGRIIFVLLLVLTFGIGIALYVLVGSKTTTTTEVTTPNKPERQISAEIAITGSPREQIMADIFIAFGDTTLASGKIREIAFTVNNVEGGTSDASTAELFTALAHSIPPETLLRSLDETNTYGIYTGEHSLAGFFKVTSRSYPETFAGMLEWENSMANDLAPALNPNYGRTGLVTVRNKPFTDERLEGVDARVLRDDSGILLIAYTILERKTLVIAGGEEALRGLILSLTETTVQ